MDTPTLPASRREVRREARREAILDVARAWFSEHGYAGTTMSAIAAELGGSKGTLWSYFRSKEELFEAVLERGTADLRAQLSLALNPSEDVESALTRFCAGFLERITGPQAIRLHRLIVGEGSRFPEIGRIYYDRALQRMQKLLGTYLEDAMARNCLRRSEPLEAARQLIALCLANNHQRVLTGSLDRMTPAMIAHDAASAMDVFIRAYAPEPAWTS